MENAYMIQNTVYFVLKGVDYFLQTRNEAKDLHVSRIFFKLGGLSGAAALSMAAYHEVAFRTNDESNTREHLTKIFETGNKMHMVNSVALLCAPCYGRPYFTGTLLTAGIILFSGS
nr:transmembrane protein 256 homolog [Crassostrea gigas]